MSHAEAADRRQVVNAGMEMEVDSRVVDGGIRYNSLRVQDEWNVCVHRFEISDGQETGA